MELVDAIEIVLSLARGAILSPLEAEAAGFAEECKKYVEACNILEDFAVNQLGDD
jgi:hypothetical protein